eukprot:1068369-Rhodomonas_salina.1
MIVQVPGYTGPGEPGPVLSAVTASGYCHGSTEHISGRYPGTRVPGTPGARVHVPGYHDPPAGTDAHPCRAKAEGTCMLLAPPA